MIGWVRSGGGVGASVAAGGRRPCAAMAEGVAVTAWAG
jgi:hypothetical protein